MSEETPFLIGSADFFFEGGGTPDLGAEILRALQPTSAGHGRPIQIHTHKASEPFPTEDRTMIIDFQVVLYKRGIKISGGGDCHYQRGTANGKRFYAIYSRISQMKH